MKALQMRRSSKPVNAGPLEAFEAASVMVGGGKKGEFAEGKVFSKSRRFAAAQIISDDFKPAGHLKQFEVAIKDGFWSKCVIDKKSVRHLSFFSRA